MLHLEFNQALIRICFYFFKSFVLKVPTNQKSLVLFGKSRGGKSTFKEMFAQYLNSQEIVKNSASDFQNTNIMKCSIFTIDEVTMNTLKTPFFKELLDPTIPTFVNLKNENSEKLNEGIKTVLTTND